MGEQADDVLAGLGEYSQCRRRGSVARGLRRVRVSRLGCFVAKPSQSKLVFGFQHFADIVGDDFLHLAAE